MCAFKIYCDSVLLQGWRKMPNYSILVHLDDRTPAQTTYVPEVNIEIISGTKVNSFLFKEK